LIGRRLENLDLARCDDVRGIPRVTFAEQGGTAGERTCREVCAQSSERVVVETGEEIDGAKVE
jgi:hypothetical protein